MATEWRIRTSVIKKDEDIPDNIVAGGGDFQDKKIWWAKLSDLLADLPNSNFKDEKVKSSSTDPTAGYLDSKVRYSVEVNSDFIQLTNDVETPLPYQVYGTNPSGTRTWIDKASLVVELTDDDLAVSGDPQLSDFANLVTANNYEDAFIFYGTADNPELVYYVDKEGSLLNILSSSGGNQLHYGTDNSDFFWWIWGPNANLTTQYVGDKVQIVVPEGSRLLSIKIVPYADIYTANNDLLVEIIYLDKWLYADYAAYVPTLQVTVHDANWSNVPTENSPNYFIQNVVTGIYEVETGSTTRTKIGYIIQDAKTFFAQPAFDLKFIP